MCTSEVGTHDFFRAIALIANRQNRRAKSLTIVDKQKAPEKNCMVLRAFRQIRCL